jgi:hypothetical protein
MKKRKGLLSGLAMLLLNILIFGFLPVPMFIYVIASVIGLGLSSILPFEGEVSGIIGSSFILIVSTVFILLKLRNSAKTFDWFMLLLLIQFVFLNGIGLLLIQFNGSNPSDMQFDFIIKTTSYFIWIYPLLGWCYDRWWNKSVDA